MKSSEVKIKLIKVINDELNKRIRNCYLKDSSIQNKQQQEYIQGMYTGLIKFRDYLDELSEAISIKT